MRQKKPFSRRYFYPLHTDFAPYVYGKGGNPIAESMGKRVLTLPTCFGLTPEDATTMKDTRVNYWNMFRDTLLKAGGEICPEAMSSCVAFRSFLNAMCKADAHKPERLKVERLKV